MIVTITKKRVDTKLKVFSFKEMISRAGIYKVAHLNSGDRFIITNGICRLKLWINSEDNQVQNISKNRWTDEKFVEAYEKITVEFDNNV